jgi:hypothetical protein
MTEIFPEYDGSDPFKYPIREFVRQVKKALIINNQPQVRWPVILDTLIIGAAKTEYDQAIATNTIVTPHAAAADAPAAQAAEAEVAFNNRVTWLQNRFHTEEVEEEMQCNIGYLAQNANESPRSFHLRVTKYITDAGFAVAAQPSMIEQAWLNGIHRTHLNHVRSLNNMNFAAMVTTAQNQWKVANPVANRFQVPEEPEPKTIIQPARVISQPEARRIRPATRRNPELQQRYNETPIEERLDDLTRAFEGFQAHLVDQRINRTENDRVFRYDDPPPPPRGRQERQSYRNDQGFRSNNFPRERTPVERYQPNLRAQQDAYDRTLQPQDPR